MMITIHGLPPNVKYHDLKAVIKQECNVTDFILDNLLPEGNGLKKVRMGLANDSEGNHLIKILDGYNFSGYILQVTTIGKSASIQSEQQNAFPDYSRVDPWNNQAQWNSAQQQQQNQHNYQQINSYAPSNVGNQPPRTQYDQRISILDRIGPPSQGFSVTPKTSPPHTVSQVSSQPSRGGYLRSVELVDTSHVPQRQDNFVGTHNRPTTINKDNFRGRQYNTPTEQNLGHYQQQSWGPQVPKQDLLPKNPRTAYDTPSQDKRAPIKDAIKDMSFKEKHQFQGRALEISSQERIDSTRRNIPSSDIHMSHPRRFSPPERRVSPNARRTSPERPGRPSSPSYRPVIPDSQYRPFQESQSYRASSPSNRQIVQSGRRVSPGRRMSPTAQRISPFGRSISMQGRPVSPSRRRISPGRKMSPTGRGRARHVSPMRKEAMDERNISGRREDMRRTSPKRPVQERYSPARNFNDTRLAKQVRPAYDSALDSKQATYSGGFRQNENVRYANKGREERADPWTNRVGEHNKSHAEDRRDMGRMAKFELPRSIEHSRVMEDEVKRSSSRNRESRSPRRERSPIRDRFKRHSPSPRSPRRSWALEKRRSPEDAEVPPPPIWPGQDHSAIKDIREKRKPYPAQAQASRGPTWDMNKYEPTLNERREIRTTADDRRVFERPSIQVRKDLEKWKPIGNDSPKLSPPRYKPEENERALRRRDIEIRHQDHRMQDNERKIRPDRKEFEEPRRDDERHYKSAFTDASEFSKIKEELTRRIEKKSEILKKQEELQKEIEDVYKRAADFTKKAEYRKGDRRHDGYKEQRSRDDLDPKEFDLPTLTRLKEERRERYYEREDTRPESRDKISRHEDSRADDASEKRNKACESITDKILEKFGGMLPKDILLRVQKEMKVAVRKILNRMFGDEDVSFIEMIIKFNSKHSTKDEEDIYDRVLASFSYQFKNIKRPAKDEPSEIAAKIPKMSPISNVEKDVEATPSYQLQNWHYNYGTQQVGQIPTAAFIAPQYMFPYPTFFPGYAEVPQSVKMEIKSESEGYALFLCKDDFQPINGYEADLLKNYIINQIGQVSQNGQGWSPDCTLKGLQSPFRYEVLTRDTASRDWLLGVDFSKLMGFKVLVYSKEELWYERAAIWLPGHSRCRIEPLEKLKLQNKCLKSINIGTWKVVKKIVTARGTRIYVDMPPSSARALENHKMMLSYELQKVSVFLKAVAVDKDAFDAGLKDCSFNPDAIPQSPMPSLPNSPNAIKFCETGDKPVSLTIARKIKDSIVYHLFKYLQSGGSSRTDFVKHGFTVAGYFGVVPENDESKLWLTSVEFRHINNQPITVVGADDYHSRSIKMFIVLPGEQLCNSALVLERLRVSNQGVKGINFNKWQYRKMEYQKAARQSTYEFEMDLDSIERIEHLKFQLDYVVNGVEKVVYVKSQYPESKLREIIQKYKDENSDKYDVANMELSSGSESGSDEVVCLD
ncbi:uncharacterized protein LOC123717447 isoform X1 [Pieris brassicae]|uniref:DUF4780 domain-containing protein n=1 Tax=Pieris brassicae TaxID=7116 RepID=A0A9P0U1C6_PIEBR|nr:uncharacterized protein LOC123717447 isoform X1 [Pieris brassicae]CAH4037488.1 unnamed protein product [Pieris brassicae]